MDVRNCRECGKLFNFVSGPPLCETCRKKLEDKFAEVKEYIRDNPNSSVNEVSEAMDVTVKQIKQWIKEERLTVTVGFASSGDLGIVCEQCGKPIETGRFCQQCKNSMANGLTNAFRPAAPAPEPQKSNRDGNKMRFIKN